MATAVHNVQEVTEGQTVFSFGNLAVNLDNYRVTLDGDDVYLTYHEVELLHVLMENADRVLPYDFIARAIWRRDDQVSIRHLNVLVHRLRSKLAGSKPYWIETVRGRGYGLLKAPGREESNEWL